MKSKTLQELERMQQRQDATAHARDSHSVDRGDSYKPVKVVGGDEHKSSHNTVLQRQLKADSPHPRGSDTKGITIFQKQLAAGGSQTGVPKNKMRTWAQQTIGHSQPLGS